MSATRKESRVRAAPPSSRASVAICQSETKHTHTQTHRIERKERHETELVGRWGCNRNNNESGGAAAVH